MTEFEGVRVAATSHATDQALRRVPLLRGAGRSGASFWIERTAAKALIAGRRSKTLPRWCSRDTRFGRSKMKRHGTYRFVWDEPESAVFVLVLAHEKDHEDGASWVVLTVLVPDVRPEALVS